MSENNTQIFLSVPYEKLIQDIGEVVAKKIIESQKPEDPEELIKVADIAKEKGCCVKTLTNRIKDKRMETGKIGRFVAIPRKYKQEILKRA